MTDTDSERSSRTTPERSDPRRERSGGDVWPQRDLWMLLGITLAGAALRLFRIEQWSLSAAEASTWRGATTPLADTLTGFYPLPFCALRWLFDAGVLATYREDWLRLPFAFVGILAVPLAAAAAGRLASRSTALLTAALLALHPWHVAVSQTATTPGIALFFAMAAVAIMPRGRARWWRWLGPACCLLLAVLCDPFAWLLVVVVAGLVLASCWSVTSSGASSGASRPARFAIAGACTLLLVASVSWAVRRASADAESGVAWLGVALLRVGLPVALCAFAGLLFLRPVPWRLAVAIVVPGSVLGAAALAGKPADPDVLVCVLPPLLLLAASMGERCWLLARSPSLQARPGAGAIGALVLVGLAVSLATDTFLYATAEQGRRAPWRAAARETLGGPGEVTDLLVAAGVGADILTCYLRPGHWSELARDPHPGRAVQQLDAEDLTTAIESLSANAAAGRVMLVLRRDEMEELVRTEAQDPMRSFELVSVLPCPLERRDETLYVFRRPAQ